MRYLSLLFFLILSCFFPVFLPAQKAGLMNQEQLDRWAMKYAQSSWDLFYELLAIPNDAHFPEEIEKNIRWCEQAFQSRGFSTGRLATPTIPLLLAERKVPGAKKTVLIYLQLDGQPVDPTKWFQEDPWKPVLKARDASGNWAAIPWERLKNGFDPEWRIFARSASDAKGPVAMYLMALDAMKEMGAAPNFNMKVIMDFEEELGSPQLPDAVDRYKKELASDLFIILDGPRHISNEPTLTFGARGISTVTLTVFGPRVPQHSGHYGNYAPNPAMRLAQLLATMKDQEGRVTIPGFYDGIQLDKKTMDILANVPDDETFIKQRLGISQTDKVGRSYQESLQYPSLNIRGMSSAWIGEEVRTIVPATATAEIDIRLVVESDPDRLIGLVRRHIEQQGYHLISNREPTDEERMEYPRIASFRASTSYLAFRTDFDSEAGQWLDRAMKKAFGKEPIKIRNSGGSIPISPFITSLEIPAVTVPTVNSDNNQHSPNENIRLGNYVDGIKTVLAILTEPL